ncbi:hypothetical protein [Sandarakinorhabdus limnophila]|uniref:hypothetical protein n=1 Tax=Sandarakinorhabdus limnophila TaxID=210512 RepID=UPI0004901CA7|nr:hypothetical protein [Sandarakinorhabdus limnophila]
MNAQTMRRIRQLHLYIGVFFLPAILFFAISGGLQAFRLQQASGWDGAPPPAWMGSVHIDQTVPHAEPSKQPAAAKAPADPVKEAERAARKRAALPMKIFVAVLAAALALSALLGAAIALNSRATRRTAVLMLVAGTAVPLALLLA